MIVRPRCFLAIACVALVPMACFGPRHLETRLGNQTLEEQQAVARKIDGRWQVEFLLPAGRWQVESREGQTWDLLPNEPRATLRWTVAPDRWSQQDRPFRFDLVSETGMRLSYSVVYPNTLPGQSLVLNVLRIITGKAQ